MSSGALSGVVTAILIVLFLGVWIWAWSARRKSQFDQAARLPLEEDDEVSR
jgi:cytochrome c oxidase cbb3-type subunit IV